MVGRLITFEGPEGSGKSTQIARLAARLRDLVYDVLEIREPGGTAIGEEIRTILLRPRDGSMLALTELFLFLAARAQIVDEVILPAIAEGKIVLCDRFADSTTAYQSFARGIDRSLVDQLNDRACQGRKPDLTLLLDLPVEEGLARQSEKDRLDSETIGFHSKVRDGYLALAREERDRIHVIDASASPDEVEEAIWRAVTDECEGSRDETSHSGNTR